MSATPEQFINAARGYLGVSWQHQGRTRAGVDCVGLLVCAAREAGILLDDVRNYRPQADGERFAQLLHQHCVKVDDAQPGDLLAIKYSDQPQHLMIVTRLTSWGPFVIHSFDKVVEHVLDTRWYASNRARLYATFRPKAFLSEQ